MVLNLRRRSDEIISLLCFHKNLIMVQRHYANRPNTNWPNANRLNANFTISGPMPTVRMPTNPNANLKIELTTPNLT
jgi:hypothetical protein